MATSIVVSIIGGCVSLLGIWLSHYLAIRREFLFRGLATQKETRHASQQLDPTRCASVPVSRKSLLRDWRRSLLAVAICPLVDTFASLTIVWTITGNAREDLPFGELFWHGFVPFAAVFYFVCVFLVFPLLIVVYREVTHKLARLIFAVLIWSVLSGALFFALRTMTGPELGWSITIAAIVGGGISGLVYWLITYTSFSRPYAEPSHLNVVRSEQRK
jgi:hypothetical protein